MLMDELAEKPMVTTCSSIHLDTVYVILYDSLASNFEMDWLSSDFYVPYNAVQMAYTQDRATFLLRYGSTTSYMFNWGYQYLEIPDKTMDLVNNTIVVYTSGVSVIDNATQLLEQLVGRYPRKKYVYDGYIPMIEA
ncbi:hypothetical protein GGI20_001955 [Coemansia sp. BCRC 34301]|nr:hypothetical protein GGI20_001955 [Coemansia sp. BCRC 34301]